MDLTRAGWFGCLMLAVQWLAGLTLAQSYQAVDRAATKPPPEMADAQTRHEAEIDTARRNSQSRLQALNRQYDQALEQLQKAFQQKGNLDGLLAVRAERQLLAGERVSGDVPKAPAELEQLRGRYQQQVDRISDEERTQSDQAHRNYVRALQELQRKYTKAGDLDTAVLLRDEIERYADLAKLEPAPSPPPAPVAEPKPGPPPSGGGQGLVLSQFWQMLAAQSKGGDDLTALLSLVCTARADLTAAPQIELYRGISYLVPVESVRPRLGGKTTIRKPVACSEFPRDSFFYHVFDVNDPEGFSKLLLLCDKGNQVVGVELIDESPKSSTIRQDYDLRDKLRARDWKMYDFAQGTTKGSTQLCVQHNVAAGNRAVRVDSELLGWKGDSSWRSAKTPCDLSYYSYSNSSDVQCRKRVRLLLAQPVAELIVHANTQR